MRIAVGGISHETNTFSTLRTGAAEFSVQRGEEICRGELLEEMSALDMEIAPTLVAGAGPHGPVVRETYLSLKEELLARLEASLPVDGVFLRLHGAMEVEAECGGAPPGPLPGLGDGESDLARAVRERVGPDVPVVASLDLHGNIAPEFVAAVNLMTALRTAPHRDGRETRRRALGHLARCVREGLRPRGAMVKLPLVLPGEHAVTETEPARSLYAMLPEIEATPGILDASLMIGCAWTDSPYSTVSALVMAADDAALAHREATRLAGAVWERRADFGPDTETASVEECIARAMSAPEPTVFISDSGDNVTAGGAGDNPLFVERLLAAGASRAVVGGIADPEAVAACAAAGVGGRVSLDIGGKLDRVNGRPLPVTGVVRHLHPGEEPGVAALQVDGVTVLLTTDRRAFASFDAFERAGVRPLEEKIVVVKLGYLFPDLRDRAPRALMALSPGFTSLRLDTLPYRRLPRPIFPLDPEVTWKRGFGA